MPRYNEASVDLLKGLGAFLLKDRVPDIFAEDPFNEGLEPLVFDWAERPALEKTANLIGGAEQLIVPQSYLDIGLDYALWGMAPSIGPLRKLLTGSLGEGVKPTEALARMPDVQFGRSHEGVLRALMADDPDLALDIAEKQIAQEAASKEVRTVGGDRYGLRAASEVTDFSADDAPLLRKLIEGVQERINAITGRMAPYDEFVDVPPTKQGIRAKPAESVENATYDPSKGYKIEYPEGGYVDPRTGLRLPRTSLSSDLRTARRAGADTRGIEYIEFNRTMDTIRPNRFDDVSVRRPVTRKYTELTPGDQKLLSEAMNDKMRLVDDAGLNWVEFAPDPAATKVKYVTGNDPNFAGHRSDIEFSDAIEKANRELEIEGLQSPKKEAAATSNTYKQYNKEIDDAMKFFEKEYGVEFSEELPATNRLIEAQKNKNSFLGNRRNKIADFEDPYGFWVKETGKGSGPKQYMVTLRPTKHMFWTNVRSLRERARLAASMNDVKGARRLNRAADEMKDIATYVEMKGDEAFDMGVIEAIQQSHKTTGSRLMSDLGEVVGEKEITNPFVRKYYDDIVNANRSVPQGERKLGQYRETGETEVFGMTDPPPDKWYLPPDEMPYTRAKVERTGDYFPQPASETAPTLPIPTQARKEIMLKQRGADVVAKEMEEINRMIAQLGEVPPAVRKKLAQDIVQRMKSAYPYKDINVGPRMTPVKPLTKRFPKKGN